jgi:hypothetical protein
VSLSARGLHFLRGGGAGDAGGADPSPTPVVDVVMPSGVKDEILSVATGIKSLDRAIELRKEKLPAEFVANWQDFRQEWERFAADHDSWLSRTWYKSYQKTLEYRRRLDDWRQQLEQLAGSIPSPNLGPGQKPAGLPSIPWKPIAYGALAIAGLYAVARVFSSGAELKREFPSHRQLEAA